MAVAVAYGKLERSGRHWHLYDVKPHVALRLKSMFPRIQKAQTGNFTFPCSPEASADLEWFMQRYPLEMSPEVATELMAGAERFRSEKAELEAILLPGYQAQPSIGFRAGHGPRPPQAQARDVLLRRKSLLLGDDVGLGKTWTAMSVMVGSDLLPAAVVVDTDLALQWKEDFIEKYTFLSCHIIQSTTPYNLPPANVYIFKYSNIHGWADVFALGGFRLVFFDEIQSLRQGPEDTKKGQAAKILCDNAEIRCGMSATPVFNYGDEMFNIVEFLEPGLLGTREEFIREWCTSLGNGKWEVTDPEALGEYLREVGFLIRRVRDGRRINANIIKVPYDKELAATAAERARVLAIRTTTGSFTERGMAARELDAFARQQTGVSKARSVAAYARIFCERGVPILLAGWHREVYKIWLEDLAEFKPMLYTGSENASQKRKTKNAFIEGRCNPLMISLRSGRGIDGLQHVCDTVLVGELDWSGAVYEQLFGRVDREGQKSEAINAYFLVTDAGADPTMMRVNSIKKYQQQGIMDPGLGIIPVRTDESHIKALAKSFLEGRL